MTTSSYHFLLGRSLLLLMCKSSAAKCRLQDAEYGKHTESILEESEERFSATGDKKADKC
jgi:hypothetical protein